MRIFDHFLASGEMKKATAATLCLHKDDRELWDMLEIQCQAFGVPYIPVPPPDYWLADEETIQIGRVSAIALHTPGHTPGSMSFSSSGRACRADGRYPLSWQHRTDRSVGRRF